MNILNNWILYVFFYLILATIFTQFYKVATKTLTKSGALTVLLEIIGNGFYFATLPIFRDEIS